MLSPKDRLDGTYYPLLSCMMRHVLVVKHLCPTVEAVEVCIYASPSTPLAAKGNSCRVIEVSRAPIAKQARWDGQDANAHALKKGITQHIKCCVTAKFAWSSLASLYQVRNEAWVAYLKRQSKSWRSSQMALSFPLYCMQSITCLGLDYLLLTII